MLNEVVMSELPWQGVEGGMQGVREMGMQEWIFLLEIISYVIHI
jgi:hypothetical protein